MLNRYVKFLLVLAVLFGQQLTARPLTNEEKLRDFQQLVTTMKSGYGPLEYKKQELGIDIDLLEREYISRISQTTNNSDYYFAVSSFVAEFKDSHFSVSIPSDYRASLGFLTDLIGGKVIVVNPGKAGAEYGLSVGDEITNLGGRDVMEVIDELSSYIGMGYDKTSKRFASWLLANRSESRMPVPSGEVSIEFIKADSRETVRALTTWNHSGTPASEMDGKFISVNPAKHLDLSLESMYESLGLKEIGPSFACSGTTRTPIPENATMIMEKPFVAYFHPTKKGNIGYLRIPHYLPRNAETGEYEFELRLAQYRYAVNELEKNTVGLVIDQGHNCGGSVGYLGEMASLFLNETVDAIPFRLLGSKASLLEMKRYLDNTPENTLERALMESTYNAVREAWLSGEFLSEKTSFTDVIRPSNVVRYTKPILMLIDEMSGSGGDAFPSLLGGVGRATLFGERTMGAGGHVVEEPALSYSGIRLRMTKSLFYRPDGVAVENNGAVPHIPYQITASDAANGFHEYQKAYLAAIDCMID